VVVADLNFVLMLISVRTWENEFLIYVCMNPLKSCNRLQDSEGYDVVYCACKTRHHCNVVHNQFKLVVTRVLPLRSVQRLTVDISSYVGLA